MHIDSLGIAELTLGASIILFIAIIFFNKPGG